MSSGWLTKATAARGARRSAPQVRQTAAMDAQELRELQKPLKDRYKSDPSTALVTLHAEGSLGNENLTCSVQTERGLVEAGLHPASGGDGTFACSGDMLLQALVACAGVTLMSVSTARRITVSGSVRAEGDLDFRGTMGVDRETPVGFTAIRLEFDLESDADKATLDSVIATTERYCVVLQTLTNGVAISTHVKNSSKAD
jgi:uncharacterized OsmC-like protein